MARQLGGSDDQFLSYRTGEYKLHYFETPTQLKLVMLTDTRVGNMRTVLHQIWATLYVEYVVKSPLAPVEHKGGVGVANELFEGGLESFIVSSISGNKMMRLHVLIRFTREPFSRRLELAMMGYYFMWTFGNRHASSGSKDHAAQLQTFYHQLSSLLITPSHPMFWRTRTRNKARDTRGKTTTTSRRTPTRIEWVYAKAADLA